MKKIKVVTDSASDLSVEDAQKYDIAIVNLPVIVDNVEYIDGKSMNPDLLFEMMKSGKVAKTSQPAMGELKRVWDEVLCEADEIIYVPLSSMLSGSYASACQFAQEYEGRVTVLDTRQVSIGQTATCLQIQKCIEEEMTSAQIQQLFESKSNLWVGLVPGDLVYLKRGGRISPAAAALANLLKICPVLKVEDGAIDVHSKVRTLNKAYQSAIDACFQGVEYPSDYAWIIVEAGASEKAQELKSMIQEKYNVEVLVHTLKSVLVAHTGPGTIGIARTYKVKDFEF